MFVSYAAFKIKKLTRQKNKDKFVFTQSLNETINLERRYANRIHYSIPCTFCTSFVWFSFDFAIKLLEAIQVR